ncbi:hypothetical protein AGMMS49957_17350 [Synergistales bacterium]|nr:hypothetical protein AGMMS49957_17350 [Synergistales bacterium]
MPECVAQILVGLKYTDKQGKEASSPRVVGHLMKHKDGSQYIEFDGWFDWGKYTAGVGSKFFMSVKYPARDSREPGYDG